MLSLTLPRYLHWMLGLLFTAARVLRHSCFVCQLPSNSPIRGHCYCHVILFAHTYLCLLHVALYYLMIMTRGSSLP